MGHFVSDRAVKGVFSTICLCVWMSTGSTPAYAQGQAGAPPSYPMQSGRPTVGLPNQNPLLGSVPAGSPAAGELPLSLDEAIQRGLQYNLGAILSEQGRAAAEASHRRLLSGLLPQLKMRTGETIQRINLASFGFPPLPGIPELIGPFSVFDTRVFASQPIVDLSALRRYRAGGREVEAARYSYEDTRDLVALVVAGLYLQAVAGQSRIEAAHAELQFAESSYNLAVSMKSSGLVPAIDVLRAQVQMQSEQQRLIAAENEFEKDKLNLARAIGLPLAQAIRLTDSLPYAPLPPLPVEEALGRAYQARADYRSAQLRLQAAETSVAAERARRYPMVSVGADYGAIGRNVHDSRATFTAVGSVSVPIYEGGQIESEVKAAQVVVEQRRAEVEDLRGSIEADVRTSLLDAQAASRLVEVARSAVELSEQQLEQSRDRFAAGVVNNLEVVQAQDAVAQAHESYISGLSAFNLAKVTLARALGVAQKEYRQFLSGETR
jgi:outer membrane protein TolC